MKKLTYIVYVYLLCLMSVNCVNIGEDSYNNNAIRTIMKGIESFSLKDQFKTYHSLYQKSYSIESPEAINRYKIFKSNMALIKSLNANLAEPKYGINEFSDLTSEEYLQKQQTNNKIDLDENSHLKISPILIDPEFAPVPGKDSYNNNAIRTIMKGIESLSLKDQFKTYHSLYQKSYSIESPEAINRYKIFKSNMTLIKSLNANLAEPKYGINEFSDLTSEEYLQKQQTNNKIDFDSFADLDENSHLKIN